jgi:hypothetical protein
MLEVQEKKLRQAIDILSLLGTDFKVITPDGVEYGDLEVKAKKPTTSVKGLPRYPRGEVRKFFLPLLTGMKAGDAKVIDCKSYDARVISRDISSYSINTFGLGAVSCLTERETNSVQIFALKNLG